MDKQLQIVQISEPSPETFRGKSVGQIVAKAIDDVVADYTLFQDGISEKVATTLKSTLTKYLRKRLVTLDDTAVAELEEKLERLEADVGEQDVRQDRRFKEQLICLMLYTYNEGEPLELRKDEIRDMEDVQFRYEVVGEDDNYIRIFTVEEDEQI